MGAQKALAKMGRGGATMPSPHPSVRRQGVCKC